LKKHKLWFNEGCSKLLDQRKYDKLQWLQDRREINDDNLNNIRHEASRHFRKKKRKYLKDKINYLATKNKSKKFRDLYRRINEFKKGYQPKINLVKDENNYPLAESHNILNMWKNYFSQLLNVYRVTDVRQIKIQTAEPLVPETSPSQVKTVIAKLKRYTSNI
jgi:hypothetical protein